MSRSSIRRTEKANASVTASGNPCENGEKKRGGQRRESSQRVVLFFFSARRRPLFSSLSGKSADRVILFFDVVSQEIIDTQIVIEMKDFDPRTRTIKKSKKRENDS